VIWTIRPVVATALWGVTLPLVFFLVFSGWWLFAPFLFATGGGEQLLILIVAIAVLATTAHLIGRRQVKLAIWADRPRRR
jgi:hypothetical protein